MATHKVWNLHYVVGNPKVFSKITAASGSPMMRREALESAATVSANGGGWRVWVEHAQSGKRIFESAAELAYRAHQAA